MNELTKFEQALKVDPTPLLKKKGNSSYLPWASAFSEFKKIYPNGNYEFIKNEDGGYVFEERIKPLNSTSEESSTVVGYFVTVRVTDGEEAPLTHELSLPLMTLQNKANMNFTVMEVNKALLRCLTKGISMFGIGLTTYAGEEYYQYEIGAELDDAREELITMAKEMSTYNERAKAVKIIGYDGRVAQIKDIEEANEKKALMQKALDDAIAKSKKETKTTNKTEKEEK